jgi:transcriptional regulator with XRE-family HTH domain
MELGERIRHRRTELGWTQDTLAQKSGLSKGFLSDLENGKRGTSAENLLDLARVLAVSLDFLMKGEDGKPSNISQQVEIPRPLADFAETAGLSFRQTLTLLQMQRQIVAHRSVQRKDGDGGFDWAKFYQSVKEFL